MEILRIKCGDLRMVLKLGDAVRDRVGVEVQSLWKMS